MACMDLVDWNTGMEWWNGMYWTEMEWWAGLTFDLKAIICCL